MTPQRGHRGRWLHRCEASFVILHRGVSFGALFSACSGPEGATLSQISSMAGILEMSSVRPGPQCKPCCTGSRGLSNGVRTLNRATAPRRETATSPPVSPSQCDVLTRSESQGQGPLCRQLSCATRAGRVKKRVTHCVVGDLINDGRSSRRPWALSASRLDMRHAACDWPVDRRMKDTQ